MKPKCKKRKAFTLIDLLVSLSIMGIIGIGMFGGFNYFHASGTLSVKKTMVLKEMRYAMDQIKYDILTSRGLYNNDLTDIPGTHPGAGWTPSFKPVAVSGVTTSGNTLIIIVPSLNASGGFLDPDDPTYIDYICIYKLGDDLVRETFICNASGSSRSSGTITLAKNITSIAFAAFDNDSVSYQALGTFVSAELDDIESVRVTLEIDLVGLPGAGGDISRKLVMNAGFRNYEFVS